MSRVSAKFDYTVGDAAEEAAHVMVGRAAPEDQDALVPQRPQRPAQLEVLRGVRICQQREAYYRHISFRPHEHHRHEDAVVPPSALVEARRDTSRLKHCRGAFCQNRVPACGICVPVALGREAAVVEDQLWVGAARQSWYGGLPVR